MEHYVCTSYGTSEKAHGSNSYKLGGAEQGNLVCGVTCRDTSCTMFKKLENENLGVIVKLSMSKTELARSAIAFVDNTDLCTNDTAFNEKIQRTIGACTSLHETTGGKIQQKKIVHCCWRWVHHNRNKVIEELEAKLVVHGE